MLIALAAIAALSGCADGFEPSTGFGVVGDGDVTEDVTAFVVTNYEVVCETPGDERYVSFITRGDRVVLTARDGNVTLLKGYAADLHMPARGDNCPDGGEGVVTWAVEVSVHGTLNE